MKIVLLPLFLVVVILGSGCEKRDLLENINVAHNDSHLITPMLQELGVIISRRDPVLHSSPQSPRSIKLGEAFKQMEEQRKSNKAEVDAVKKFEKAMDDLSEAIKNLNEVFKFGIYGY